MQRVAGGIPDEKKKKKSHKRRKKPKKCLGEEHVVQSCMFSDGPSILRTKHWTSTIYLEVPGSFSDFQGRLLYKW